MRKRQDRVLFNICCQMPVLLGILLLMGCQQPGTAAPTITPSPGSASETPIEITATVTPTKTPEPDLVFPSETPLPLPSKTTHQEGCTETAGQLQLASFFSAALQDNLSYRIYLPPCYNQPPEPAYPVVYLLHGLGYTHEQWVRLGLVEKMDTLISNQNIPPFIVIMPQENHFDSPQSTQFDEAVVADLVPWVDSHYRTLPEASFRAIGGISRGGAWAVRIGLNHYDVFGKVGAHSLPLFDSDGGKVYTWLSVIPQEDFPTFYIDIGRNDPEWKHTRAFADLLNSYSVPHEWYFFVGEHSEAYWAAHLDEYLKWYGSNW